MSYHARLFLLGACLVPALYAQSPQPAGAIPFDSLARFATPTTGWQLGSSLNGDPRLDATFALAAGTGLLTHRAGAVAPLVTTATYGDVVLDVDFVASAQATPAIWFQGRYAVQLPSGAAGTSAPAPAPAARAAGLWQHLHVEFRAPRFNAAGQKTAPARFSKIVLNGFTLYENLDVTAPSAGAPFTDEQATGPLVLTAGQGGIAYRTLVARPPAPPAAPAPAAKAKDAKAKKAAKAEAPVVPIPVEVTDRIIVQRGFVPFEPTKRLYAVSVGTPAGIHFAYDLETSAILRVWRGHFIDAREMWEGRSANQWAKPTGPALTLPGLPLLAPVGPDATAAWPAQADSRTATQGYVIEHDGQPTFLSTFGSLTVRDRIAPTADGRGFTRTITLSGTLPDEPVLLLLASARAISRQPGGRGYTVGSRDYYLDFPADAANQPSIQKRGDLQCLVVPVTAATLAQPIVSTLVW